MNAYIKSGAYKWLINVPLNNIESISFNGPVKIEREQNVIIVSVPDFQEDGKRHNLLVVTQSKIEIHTFPANIQRCYVRIYNDMLLLSNTVASLIKVSEKIRLNGEVLLRQISNIFAPLDDMFNDVKLLNASSVFKIYDRKITFSESRIKPVKSSISLVENHILEKFDRICQKGNPLAILLSAGIDSRLNLALCSHFSKKYKNEIIIYHEYKDKKEHDLAKHIADKLKLPFISISRDRHRKEPLKYILSSEFIEFHGGIYRDSIARWYNYMDLIRFSNPDSTIIGMSADAHKGRFYRDIHKLPEDATSILEYKMKNKDIPEVSFSPYLSNRLTDEFFSTVSLRSSVFERLTSRIDFIFYHSRTAKQSTSRTPFFHTNYNIPFPFYDDEFLSLAFSLPKESKIDAAIPKNLIHKLNPELSKIPYISGNKKAFRSRYVNKVRTGIDIIFPKPKDIDRRNENIEWSHSTVMERLDGSSSEITRKLEKFIREKISERRSNGQINSEAALRIYLFLRQIEKELGVEFLVE